MKDNEAEQVNDTHINNCLIRPLLNLFAANSLLLMFSVFVDPT